MKNLPDILKEFENEFGIRFIGSAVKLQFAKEFISEVYTHAVQNCLEVLPVGFDTKGTLLDIYREQFEDGFNSCRTLSEQSIKSLLDKEIKE